MRVPTGHRVAKLLTAVSMAVAALGASTALATPALAGPSGDLASATNNSRAAAHLPALQLNGQLSAVAQAWANRLAAAGALSHNPALRSQVTGWTVLGENVGMAGDIPTVQAAFMASAAHRANILDARYTQMGVGSASSINASCKCAVLWVVVDFRRPTAAPAAVAAPAPRKPAPAVKAAPVPARPATAVKAPAKVARAKAAPPAVTKPAGSTVGVHRSAIIVGAQPSATALSTGLAASASSGAPGTASDPVSRVLMFATVLAGLTG
ncbi:MAG: hypothetical protein QOJ62_2225 [Actinomycetota bacterium]|nr:hypothetical protein [Actinomycetota bacterium]